MSKALGVGIWWRGGIGWTDAEVVADRLGKPGLVLYGRARVRAEALGLAPELHRAADCLEVRLPENLADATVDALEAACDELLELDQALTDDEDAAGGHYAAGVVVRLGDGRSVYADVAPELLNRLLTVITPQELGGLVDAIVSAVEQPDERPLCKR